MKSINFTYALLAIVVSVQEVLSVPQESNALYKRAPVSPLRIDDPSQVTPVKPQEINDPSQVTPIKPQEINDPSQVTPLEPQIIVDPFFETNDSSKQKCPHPFEVGAVSLNAYFNNMQFVCSNRNRDTGCLHRDYKVPDEKLSPGGCKRRNEPPVMDAIVRNYDCRSGGNHWSFANEMVNKYNLTCDFIKKSSYY